MSRTFLVGTAAVAAMCVTVVAFSTGTDGSTGAHEQPRAATARLAVEGMTCGGCEAGVELKVRRLEGVEDAKACYERSEALVTYTPDRVTLAQILEAIEELGYSAELVEEKSDTDDPDALLDRTSG